MRTMLSCTFLSYFIAKAIVGTTKTLLVVLFLQTFASQAQTIRFDQPFASNEVVQLKVRGPANEWFWIESSTNLLTWKATSTNQFNSAGIGEVTSRQRDTKTLYRAAYHRLNRPFQKLFTVRETINLNGNNFIASSYDGCDSKCWSIFGVEPMGIP
jgi:hypothetical protein